MRILAFTITFIEWSEVIPVGDDHWPLKVPF